MKTKSMILCALFAALTAAGAFIRIPIPGTPLLFTLQTFFVFLSGLMLIPRYALIAQIVYAAVGLLGLPVFSTGGGITYVLTPSFGFIIGFAVCALLISMLVRKNLLAAISDKTGRKKHWFKTGVYALLSLVALYVCGVTYMYVIFNVYLGQTMTLLTVIVNATGIFFLLDIIKFALAIAIGTAVLKRMPVSLIET